jgi:hypothetical protein
MLPYWERSEQIVRDLEPFMKHSRAGYFAITGREFGTPAPYPAGASSIGSFGGPPMARCGWIPGEEKVHGNQSTSVRPARCP